MAEVRATFEHVEKMTQQHGWFQNQLWVIESALNGRWAYWWAILLNRTIGELPDWKIPRLEFSSHCYENSPLATNRVDLSQSEHGQEMLQSVGSPAEAKKHILKVFERAMRNGNYLRDLIDWWLFAFGSPRITQKPKLHEEAAIAMYSDFELHRLIGNPADWGSVLGLEFTGGNKGTAWFPTPMCLAEMMTQMTFGGQDCRCKSVNDCCVGTGVFMLVASNHSLNLSCCDIDPLMVSLCEFAGWLYIPWLVYGNKQFIKEFREDRPAESEPEAIEVERKENQEPELAYVDKKNPNQGLLFEMV